MVFNENYKNRYYGKKDFSEDSVLVMKNNFENNLIKKYLENKEYFDKKFPIFKNPILIKWKQLCTTMYKNLIKTFLS